jgi:carbon storage regulator
MDCEVVSSENSSVGGPETSSDLVGAGGAGSLPCEAGNTMLVLSRKKNESIVINDDIVITVVEVRGDKVRLGIQAPRDVSVHRSEVHAAIHNELNTETPELPADSTEISP